MNADVTQEKECDKTDAESALPIENQCNEGAYNCDNDRAKHHNRPAVMSLENWRCVNGEKETPFQEDEFTKSKEIVSEVDSATTTSNNLRSELSKETTYLNQMTLEKKIEALSISDLSTSSTYVRPDQAQDTIVSASYGICYAKYKNELQMPAIMYLITKDLSEPYSIYTYRYFIHNWPHLCFLAIHETKYVGAIVCKLDLHKKVSRRGYIAMLAVDETVRRRKIGTNLVKLAIEAMTSDGCDEVVLETEVTNHSALRLYENLGFVRDKRLFRYYLNGVDALRLKLWLC